jgi:hypothetical protein
MTHLPPAVAGGSLREHFISDMALRGFTDKTRKLIRLRYPRKLPIVLSPDEAARLIAATTCLSPGRR